MRSLRCDNCGTKALTAASQCPKCSHLFDVHDGFGGLLPLAYCSSCDSYYPERRGSCKWCGTKPEAAPVAPHVWKGIGAAAVIVLVGTTWLLRDTEPDYTDTRARTEQKADSTPPSTPTVVAVAPPAVAAPPAATPLVTPSADSSMRVQVASAGTVERDTTPMPTPVPTPPIPIDASPPAVAPITPASPPAAASKTTTAKTPATSSKSRASARWVNSVSRGWVVVRAGPSKQSRLVASIGPNSRVQLGETRGDWRRIRARGITGWVETRASFAVVPMALRTRTVVSR